MDLSIDKNGAVTIIRILSARVTYPLLPALVEKTKGEGEAGARSLVLDLSAVSYIDSATIGCIMDIYRLAKDQDGGLHILAPQARVETMLRRLRRECSSSCVTKSGSFQQPFRTLPARDLLAARHVLNWACAAEGRIELSRIWL